MPSRYLQGKYQPQFPDKYVGDVRDVVFRSSWELIAFKFCDYSNDIIKWSSETVIIPYRGVDGLMHRYFMDLSIVARQADGSTRRFLVEIKPESKLTPPRNSPNKKEDNFRREVLEYQTNQLKWEAARAFCKKQDMTFIIWTEKTLLPSAGNFANAKKASRPTQRKAPRRSF